MHDGVTESTGRVQQGPGHVAILIDFENLAYSLRDQFGDERIEEMLSMDGLFRLASDYGTVATARAYADWRWKHVNQFQMPLYRAGIDLVHVFGRGNGGTTRNSADVCIATDAIETIWVLPHVATFLVVSGDRDFLPMMKMLRRYGKTVVGVAPDGAASRDLAALCDRFLLWSSLVNLYGGEAAPSSGPPEADSGPIAATLQRLLAARAAVGIKGAQLKPLLRHEHPTFDESQFGFSSLQEFLGSLPEVVRIEKRADGGDMTLWPADAKARPSAPRVPAQVLLARQAGLSDYRFEPDAATRRQLIGLLHELMVAATARSGSFTWQEVADAWFERPDAPVQSNTVLAKYWAVLFQGRCFEFLVPDDPNPLRTRAVRLVKEITGAAALVARYESSLLFKLQEALQREPTTREVLDLLGLPQSDTASAAELLERVRVLRRMATPRGNSGTSRPATSGEA